MLYYAHTRKKVQPAKKKGGSHALGSYWIYTRYDSRRFADVPVPDSKRIIAACVCNILETANQPVIFIVW